MYYIGIDLGTSSAKGILTDRQGNILGEKCVEYPVYYPHSGWSEQDPADWLSAAKEILSELSCGRNDKIGGISFGGQMHGLVLLDKNNNIIRPAILWNDGRTQKQTDYLNNIIGKDKLSELTANIAFAGFTAPKILWVKENEPENFARIAKIMLPKDYLAYMLTGIFSTDYSDASGMLLLDVKNKRWSDEMCNICGITVQMLPKLHESFEVIGKPLSEYNLPNAIVTAGAGDNAAAAIGTGTINNGDCNISLGTSGTIFISGDTFVNSKNNALHSFAHATGKWHLMGCILSAASCNKWWTEEILGTSDYSEQTKNCTSMLGKNNVYFLPYLMGERSPHNDVDARGAFIGICADTSREQLSLAVLEGVVFALKDCIEAAKQNGLSILSTNICGGGAKSSLWKQIIANVLNVNVCSLVTEQGPAYGAAILAMVGAGEYDSINDAVKQIVRVRSVITPDSNSVTLYEQKYEIFRSLYPALKNVFHNM